MPGAAEMADLPVTISQRAAPGGEGPSGRPDAGSSTETSKPYIRDSSSSPAPPARQAWVAGSPTSSPVQTRPDSAGVSPGSPYQQPRMFYAGSGASAVPRPHTAAAAYNPHAARLASTSASVSYSPERPRSSLGLSRQQQTQAGNGNPLTNLEGRPRRVMSAGTKPPWLYANMRYSNPKPPKPSPNSAFAARGVSERALAHALSYGAPRPVSAAAVRPLGTGTSRSGPSRGSSADPRRRNGATGARPSIMGHPVWIGTGDDGEHPNFVPERFLWNTLPGNTGNIHELQVLTTRSGTRNPAPFLHTAYAREAISSVLVKPPPPPGEGGPGAPGADGRPSSGSLSGPSGSFNLSRAGSLATGSGNRILQRLPGGQPPRDSSRRGHAQVESTPAFRSLSTLQVESTSAQPSWQEVKRPKLIFGPNAETGKKTPPTTGRSTGSGDGATSEKAHAHFEPKYLPGESVGKKLWALLRHRVMHDKLAMVGLKQAKMVSEYQEMNKMKKTVRKEKEASVIEKELAMEQEETIKEQMLEEEIKVLEEEQKRLQEEREAALIANEAGRLKVVRTEYNGIAGAADAKRFVLEQLRIDYQTTCAITPTTRPLINPSIHYKHIPLDANLAQMEGEVEYQEGLRDAEVEYSETLRTMLQRMIVTHKRAHVHTQAMRKLSMQYETDKQALEAIAREIEREALESQARVLMRRKEVSASHAKTEAQLVRQRDTHSALIMEIKYDAARQARAKQLEREADEQFEREIGPGAGEEGADSPVRLVFDEVLERKMHHVALIAGTSDADIIIAKYEKAFWVSHELASKRTTFEARLEALRGDYRAVLTERDRVLYGLDRRQAGPDQFEQKRHETESRLRRDAQGALDAEKVYEERATRIVDVQFGLRAFSDLLKNSLTELWPEAAVEGPFQAALEQGGDMGGLDFLATTLLNPAVKGLKLLGKTMAADFISPLSGVRRPAYTAGDGDDVPEGSRAGPTKEAVVMTLAGPQVVNVPIPLGQKKHQSTFSLLTGKKDPKLPGGLAALIAAAVDGEDSETATPTADDASKAMRRAMRASMLASMLGVKQEEDDEEEDRAEAKLPRFLYNIRVAPPRDEEEEDAPTPPLKSKYATRGGRVTPTVDDDGDDEILSMKAAREELLLGSQQVSGGSKKNARPKDELISRDMVKAAERKLLAKHRGRDSHEQMGTMSGRHMSIDPGASRNARGSVAGPSPGASNRTRG